jgi:hypothetical protein
MYPSTGQAGTQPCDLSPSQPPSAAPAERSACASTLLPSITSLAAGAGKVHG